MTTNTRVIGDHVQNILDYLIEAELALYCNPVAITDGRVTFHSLDPSASFLVDRGEHRIGQYRSWVTSGAYSALLFDASLLQFTYDVDGGRVVGHRLGYVPCPFNLDRSLLDSGEAVADILELYEQSDVLLRSPIRFDYDPASERANHAASHFTINSPDCRIACIAPLHPHRFVDFIFRNFYHQHWLVHEPFFNVGAFRQLQSGNLELADERRPHIMWRQHSSIT